MKLHLIQNSFELGELSPLMLGRSDTGPYQKGLAYCENMFVDSRGPIKSRAGTRHGYSFDAQCARLETFQVDPNVYFNIVFTDFQATITSLTGGVPAEDLILNPFFANNGLGWDQVEVGGGSAVAFETGLATMIAGNGGGSFAGIREEVALAEGTIEHTVVVTTFGTDEYTIKIGSAAGLDDYFSDVSSLGRFEAVFTPGVAGPIPVFIEIAAQQSNTVFCTAVHLFDATKGEVGFATPWPCDALRDIYFVDAPGGHTIYALHREYQPQKITYDIDTHTFQIIPVTFADPVGPPIHTAPPEWGAGNWPGVGAIFQGRLWLMSTIKENEWMWGSRSGEYEQFFVTDIDNIVANDAIMAVPMEHYGIIQWAIGTKNLVIGTINGEYIITGSDGLIRPTDMQIQRQSAYGSAHVQPRQVNDQILYVSGDRRKIRAMHYADSANNWISNDLLFLSEHLSEPNIIDIGWAQNPDNLLWATLANGNMLSCTYERNNEIIGWAHHTTQGKFIDLAIGEIAGLSTVNVLTQRVPGAFEYELMPPKHLSIPLDASVRKNDDIPFTVVEGLEHLEGMTVQVIANDAMHPDLVVTGGQVTLNKPYTDVYVGLGFTARAITLPIDQGSRTGSGASHKKRWNRIFVRVLDSAKPLINGQRAPTRNPVTPMDTPELPRTEDIDVGNLGWSEAAIVTIEQDLPLTLTLIAMFGSLAQEDL